MLRIRINKTFGQKRFDILLYLQHSHLFEFILHPHLSHLCFGLAPLNSHLHSEHLCICFFPSSMSYFNCMFSYLYATALIFIAKIFAFLSPPLFFIKKSTFFTLKQFLVVFYYLFYHFKSTPFLKKTKAIMLLKLK